MKHEANRVNHRFIFAWTMTKKNKLLTVLLCMCSCSAFSQTGTIAGKITDESNNQSLVGASVIITENSKKAVSESDGSYSFKGLTAGKYTLLLTYVGYDSKKISDVEVIKGQVTTLNIVLAQAKNNLTAVVITSTSAKKESLNSLLLTRRNAAVVSDGISADLIRKSPDKNISDVLKRISGTTIQVDGGASRGIF